MSAPDFNKKTVDTVAKRAAYRCSNPDCRAVTVGPNSIPNQSTTIGEAAHIYGARENSKRYRPDMTDTARAEITNSIWLCRNCHKLIDTDDRRYAPNILYAWREQHEEYILKELGNRTGKIEFEVQSTELEAFDGYPPVIRRIVIDKPDGWEFRLTAELMRYLYKPYFRKIKDLRKGLYTKPKNILSSDQVIDWINARLSEASDMATSITGLINKLNDSWGAQGVSGDLEEIHHITCLMRDYLEQIVLFEERVSFVSVPPKYEKLVPLLKDLNGSQAEKLEEIPVVLDSALSLINTDQGDVTGKLHVVEKTINFEVPKNWRKKFDREFNRTQTSSFDSGCSIIIIIFVILFIISMFL